MSAMQKAKLAEELLRRFAAALRAVQLYAPAHPLVARSITALAETLALTHATTPSIAIGIVGDELVVGDIPVPRAVETMGKLISQLELAGIERVVIDRGVQEHELSQLVQTVGRADAKDAAKALGRLTHIRVGRLQVDRKGDAPISDIANYRRLYDDAVSVAETLWDSAQTEGIPDADAGRNIVDTLAEEVSHNRTALLALTALKS